MTSREHKVYQANVNQEGKLEAKRTDENVTDGRLPGFLIGQKALIRLKTGESNRHLGYDAGENCTETLVQRQWRFPLHDLDPGSNEPSWFRLVTMWCKVEGERTIPRLAKRARRWCVFEYVLQAIYPSVRAAFAL